MTDGAVAVTAPGRLHLGFLDPAGTLGRRFGSLGLVVDGFATQVELSASTAASTAVLGAAPRSASVRSASAPVSSASAPNGVADGPAERAEVERAAAILDLLQRRAGRHDPLLLRLRAVLPAHAGFGSGTQLALAIGRAFAQWHRLDVDTPTLAQWLGRGARSGIGIAGFEQGGLLVDGGPGPRGVPAPLLARVDLPPAWRVLVVQHRAHEGLSGAAERDALATLPALPQALAADLCHQVLMRVLPAAAEADFAPFAAGLSAVQRVLGRHFAPAQGGSACTSRAVGRLLDWIGARGAPAAAVGQSSWGPTGFAIVESAADAATLLEAAHAARVVDPALEIGVVAARNRGASVVDRREHGAG